MLGGLLINKPEGVPSFQTVREVKRILGIRVGHTGTLDPFAEGLMLLLVGKATKLQRFVHMRNKTYTGRISFGILTDTLDPTGTIIRKEKVSIEPNSLIREVNSFVGEYEQRPPIYSALKVNGVRAYLLARRGERFRLKKKKVLIKSFSITSVDTDWADFEIEVSSGTYIRSIARDIGLKMGTDAILERLKRVKIGEFSLDNAIDCDALSADTIKHSLIPPRRILSILKSVEVKREEIESLIKGNTVETALLEGFYKTVFDGEIFVVSVKDKKMKYYMRIDEDSKI